MCPNPAMRRAVGAYLPATGVVENVEESPFGP